MSPPAADTPPDDINGIDEIDDPLEMSSASPLRERAEAVLRELVGRSDAHLREDQWRAIRALVVDRRRALVVQRTGWGKSAVYFVATVLLREGRAPAAAPDAGEDIVSTLLALGYNEREARAATKGIPADTDVGEGVRLALKNLMK